MGRGLGYLESPATEEENSCDYRVEWDDHIEVVYTSMFDSEIVHHGSGSDSYSKDYDNAWDRYSDLIDDPTYRNVRIIRIYPDGSEETIG